MRVGPNADGADSRDVTVVPVDERDALAQPGLGRREPPQGGRAEQAARWPTSTCRTRARRATPISTATSSPRSISRRAMHRRAVQRRRHAGRPCHRLSAPAAAQLLDEPRRQDSDHARPRDLRAEGDDHQRIGRLRRRRDAVVRSARRRSARWSASEPGAASSASAAIRR